MTTITKFVVYDSNNSDPIDSIWVKFDNKKQAEDWIQNFNDNARRKREFGIREELIEVVT